MVAIVDPPRAGLPKKVISVLRWNEKIESLVYVSCDSSNKLAQGNLVDLCRDSSKSLAGKPFQLVKAQPIDLFPQTPHLELVTLLLRGNALRRYQEEQESEKQMETDPSGVTPLNNEEIKKEIESKESAENLGIIPVKQEIKVEKEKTEG